MALAVVLFAEDGDAGAVLLAMERLPFEPVAVVPRATGGRGPGGRDAGGGRPVRARAQAHPLRLQPLLQGAL